MKKIMFNDKYGLTQAVLEGRKTQTRRLILPQPDYDEHKGMVWKGYMYGIKGYNAPYDAYDNFISPLKKFNRLPYNIGEEVAVAQKYSELEYGIDWVRRSINKEHAGWNNKMFVSAKEMSHRIRITNIRVERLQDIIDEDCLKEGVKLHKGRFLIENLKGVAFYTNSARLAFKYLINKLSGKHTWDSNPYVFVYDFELIK